MILDFFIVFPGIQFWHRRKKINEADRVGKLKSPNLEEFYKDKNFETVR